MRRETVLHLTGMHSTKYGGVERYLLGLTKSSARRGYHTAIQYESQPQSANYVQDIKQSGGEIIIARLRAGWMDSFFTLSHILRTIRPSIVLTHFVRGYIHLQLPFMKRRHGIRKLLAMVHSIQSSSRSWRHFAYNRYDGIIGVSRSVSASLVAIGTRPELVSTHYLGLFKENTRSQSERVRYRSEFWIKEDAIVIGCIAFESKVKGVDLLLESIARISGDFPQIHLLVIGIDPQHSSLPAEAVRLGISERTHWAGLREEGWRLLNAADLYAQPSRSEAMPFAVMEAMELGLPVIATDVGGLPEIVADGETGCLTRPDPAHFAETIKKMMAMRKNWETMGTAGHARYQEMFNGESSVESFTGVYFSFGNQTAKE